MWLTDETFRTVVGSTPLVSIDLVVENVAGEIFLGQRRNRPAQGFWFVPGGRIRKNESLDDAFRRLTLDELGWGFERCEARLLGVYDHFYSDSVFGTAGSAPNTHYVVLGYHLRLPAAMHLEPPAKQHGTYRWLPQAEMQACGEVHDNSRAYLATLR